MEAERGGDVMFMRERDFQDFEEAFSDLGINLEELENIFAALPSLSEVSPLFSREMVLMGKRHAFRKEYSFAIPSKKAIEAIGKLSPLIEIGAGTGYWAKLLQDVGADIKAFDIHPPDTGGHHEHFAPRTYARVLAGGPTQILEHPNRTLFLCWPPLSNPMAAACLDLYLGYHLVYIGEGSGGCTGDDHFHELLDANWDEVQQVWIPQWPGIHDYCTIYRRRETR